MAKQSAHSVSNIMAILYILPE